MITLPLGMDPLSANPLHLINPLVMFQHPSSSAANLSKILQLLQLRDHLQKQAANNEILNVLKPPSLRNINYHKSLEVHEDLSRSAVLKVSHDPNLVTETQIKNILEFFINNFGVIDDQDIYKERMNYVHNKTLIKLFDTLQAKYSTSTKTKEELTKWIIRRTLKTGKHTEKEIQHFNMKRIFIQNNSMRSQDDYVKINYEEESKHEQWVESLLPFKKNSKNKSMNSHFLTEIFGSEKFRRDYLVFLSNFDAVMEEDTIEKKKRFFNFILECMKQNTYEKILKYRRVPWLKTWIQNTKKVAEELRVRSIKQISCKQVKF